jgi:hypothetical protein
LGLKQGFSPTKTCQKAGFLVKPSHFARIQQSTHFEKINQNSNVLVGIILTFFHPVNASQPFQDAGGIK